MDLVIKKVSGKGSRKTLALSDGRSEAVSLETILKHGLSEGARLTHEKLAEILGDDSAAKCLDSALRLLASRQHASSELKRKLSQRGFNHAAVSKTIAECARLSLLDDAAFVERYADELAGKGKARRMISNALMKRGVAREESMSAAAAAAPESDELDSAKTLARKKLESMSRGRSPETDKRKIKDKLYRLLASRGFQSATVSRAIADVMDGGGDDDFE